MEDFIIEEFYEGMKDIDFNAYGIIDASNKIHALGTDSKIIGRIFEMYTEPVLSEIAKKTWYGYRYSGKTKLLSRLYNDGRGKNWIKNSN